MKIVVNVNIVFSALLHERSLISEILLNAPKNIEFIAPYFLRLDVKKHRSKISKTLGVSLDLVKELEGILYKKNSIYSRLGYQ